MKLLAPAPGWTAQADVIVVGSGIAGLTTALQARTYGLSVLIVTKSKVDEGSTKWAQGGIAAALGPGDTPDQHLKDTLVAGADLCDVEGISKFKSLIGSANWIITLGRFDIAYAVSTLSRYSMAPRLGHFTAMERVFGYLRKHYAGHIVIDHQVAPIGEKAQFNLGMDWIEFYPDATEDLPYDMPHPAGSKAMLTCYVDADHARDKVTCRSVTGIILLINNTPVLWISKKLGEFVLLLFSSHSSCLILSNHDPSCHQEWVTHPR